MRHHNVNRKLGRKRKGRRALMKSLASSLILRQKITTTEAKARELRPYAEKLITKGKSDNVSTRRLIKSRLGNDRVVNRLFAVVGPKYKERSGGFTRIIKLPRRKSDGSPMAVIELV